MRLMKKNATLSLILIGIWGAQGQAQCKYPATVEAFSLFSRDGIEGKMSDVQGSIATLGSLELDRYEISGSAANCVALSVGGNAELSHLQVKKNAEVHGHLKTANMKFFADVSANSAHLVQTRVDGVLSSNKNPILSESSASRRNLSPRYRVGLEAIYQGLLNTSRNFLNMDANVQLKVDGQKMNIIANQEVSIVNIQTGDLIDKEISIQAAGAKKLIINVLAFDVNMVRTKVNLSGLLANQVFWNMPNTERLYIANTADREFGLPGRFYAPKAETEFYEGLITGGLYVRSLVYRSHRLWNSGQINGEEHPGFGFLN